jgi:hypothetical protein
MKQIFLNGKYGSIIGNFALVDDEDFDFVNKYSWFGHKGRKTFYALRAKRNGKTTDTFQMHREILRCKKGDGIDVDHKDRNGLNNQKYNIRKCDQSQNRCNIGCNKNSLSKYKGVSLDDRWKNDYWSAECSFKGTRLRKSGFKSKENAAIAYNIFAERLHGEFAVYNT